MKRIIIFLTAGICSVSCSVARFQPVTSTERDKVSIDTTYVHDSVYIDRIRTIRAKADTVYVTDVKTEYKYRYRDRVKIDTLIQERVVTEVKEVEKKLTWWQRFRLKGFWYLAGAVALWIAWNIRRRI